MSKIPRSFIDSLLSAQDILFWAKRYMKLSVKGHNAFGLCPFPLKTPLLSQLTPEKLFYCFGCQKSGNSIDLLMHFEGLNFYDTVKLMAQVLGMDLEQVIEKDEGDEKFQALAAVTKAFYLELSRSQAAISYLKSRGISGQTAKSFMIGVTANTTRELQSSSGVSINDLLAIDVLIKSKTGSSAFPRFRNRLMFPIHNLSGKIIGFGGRDLDGSSDIKYLNSPESDVFNKGYALWALSSQKIKVQKKRTSLRVILMLYSLHNMVYMEHLHPWAPQ